MTLEKQLILDTSLSFYASTQGKTGSYNMPDQLSFTENRTLRQDRKATICQPQQLDIRLVPKLLYTLVTSSAKKHKTISSPDTVVMGCNQAV
jgi:hypothetical protein